MKKFKEFLSRNELTTEIEHLPEEVLATYLRLFYFKLRTVDGKYFSPSSLVGIRASIQRYMTSPEVDRNVDIIHGQNFHRANATLKAMVGQWLKSGTGKDQHEKYSAIEPADLKKMYEYFDRSNPTVLQQEAWFHIVYQFGLRGREVIRELTPSSFEMCTDSDNRNYAKINHVFLSKNVKASLNAKEYENLKSARMYEQTDDPKNAYRALELYLSKLPKDCDTLFPMPIKKPKKEWYSDKKVLGKNTLGMMMKTISLGASLSSVYTNHCVRVTVVTNLKESGFSNDDIAGITGHKSTESVRRYIRKRKDQDKQRISNVLQNQLKRSNTPHGKEIKISDESKNVNCIGKEMTLNDFQGRLELSGTFHNCIFNIVSKQD